MGCQIWVVRLQAADTERWVFPREILFKLFKIFQADKTAHFVSNFCSLICAMFCPLCQMIIGSGLALQVADVLILATIFFIPWLYAHFVAAGHKYKNCAVVSAVIYPGIWSDRLLYLYFFTKSPVIFQLHGNTFLILKPGYWKIPGYSMKNTRGFFNTPVLGRCTVKLFRNI